LFIIGAVFMLVDTFADIATRWPFWVGLGFAIVGFAFYILILVINRKELNKKLSPASYSDKTDNTFEHDKKSVQETKPTKKD
jgi:divalent metal cation (Fe/Co/Zn/Cd) transporter